MAAAAPAPAPDPPATGPIGYKSTIVDGRMHHVGRLRKGPRYDAHMLSFSADELRKWFSVHSYDLLSWRSMELHFYETVLAILESVEWKRVVVLCTSKLEVKRASDAIYRYLLDDNPAKGYFTDTKIVSRTNELFVFEGGSKISIFPVGVFDTRGFSFDLLIIQGEINRKTKENVIDTSASIDGVRIYNVLPPKQAPLSITEGYQSAAGDDDTGPVTMNTAADVVAVKPGDPVPPSEKPKLACDEIAAYFKTNPRVNTRGDKLWSFIVKDEDDLHHYIGTILFEFEWKAALVLFATSEEAKEMADLCISDQDPPGTLTKDGRVVRFFGCDENARALMTASFAKPATVYDIVIYRDAVATKKKEVCDLVHIADPLHAFELIKAPEPEHEFKEPAVTECGDYAGLRARLEDGIKKTNWWVLSCSRMRFVDVIVAILEFDFFNYWRNVLVICKWPATLAHDVFDALPSKKDAGIRMKPSDNEICYGPHRIKFSTTMPVDFPARFTTFVISDGMIEGGSGNIPGCNRMFQVIDTIKPVLTGPFGQFLDETKGRVTGEDFGIGHPKAYPSPGASCKCMPGKPCSPLHAIPHYISPHMKWYKWEIAKAVHDGRDELAAKMRNAQHPESDETKESLALAADWEAKTKAKYGKCGEKGHCNGCKKDDILIISVCDGAKDLHYICNECVAEGYSNGDGFCVGCSDDPEDLGRWNRELALRKRNAVRALTGLCNACMAVNVQLVRTCVKMCGYRICQPCSNKDTFIVKGRCGKCSDDDFAKRHNGAIAEAVNRVPTAPAVAPIDPMKRYVLSFEAVFKEKRMSFREAVVFVTDTNTGHEELISKIRGPRGKFLKCEFTGYETCADAVYRKFKLIDPEDAKALDEFSTVHKCELDAHEALAFYADPGSEEEAKLRAHGPNFIITNIHTRTAKQFNEAD
jgi:hypothetical protein